MNYLKGRFDKQGQIQNVFTTSDFRQCFGEDIRDRIQSLLGSDGSCVTVVDIGGTDKLLNGIADISDSVLPVQINLTMPKTSSINGVIADVRGALPLADESGDILISTRTFPLYAENTDQVLDFFHELKRVMAKGGKAYITPFPTEKYFSDFFLQSDVYKDFGLLDGAERTPENIENIVLPNLKRVTDELKSMFAITCSHATPNGLQSIILKTEE